MFISKPNTSVDVTTKTQIDFYLAKGDYIFFDLKRRIGIFKCEGFGMLFIDKNGKGNLVSIWTKNRKKIELLDGRGSGSVRVYYEEIEDFYKDAVGAAMREEIYMTVSPGFRYTEEELPTVNFEELENMAS